MTVVWLEQVFAERERRHRLGPDGDPREALITKLDAMAERLQAAPDYRPPSPSEAAGVKAWFEAWLRARFA